MHRSFIVRRRKMTVTYGKVRVIIESESYTQMLTHATVNTE